MDPSPSPHSRSSQSRSRSHSRHRTPSSLVPLFAQLTFFLVPAKLDVPQIETQIQGLGGERVGRPEDARILITALKGRPRLERVLGPKVTTMRNLLSDAFIRDTYALASQKGASLPLRDAYRVFSPGRMRRRSRSPSIQLLDEEPRKRRRGSSATIQLLDEALLKKQRPLEVKVNAPDPTFSSKSLPLPDIKPYPAEVRLETIPRMCVERACLLVCPNQDIIDAIKPIYTYREYDEGDQKNSNVLSYRRSVSILKSVPRRLKSGAEALKLVDVGDKVAQRIDEYLTTGAIAESETIRSSERYKRLKEFASIYSIGTSTAAELWKQGCRTLADVHAYYCGSDFEQQQLTDPREKRRQERKAAKRATEGTMTRSEIVGAWLELRDELDAEIPRSEAEEIAACIMENVEALHPGCEWTIAGGYRRGKSSVADVDVIFSPPPGEDDKGLIKALCARMASLGVISHVLHITYYDSSNPLHSHSANFDNLDKAFVVLQLQPGSEGSGRGGSSRFNVETGHMREDPVAPVRPRPPAGDAPPRLHRRVDIICAPRERYAASVLSWSGSMMYERDLRRVAESKGYKFRAGLIDSQTSREINFSSEREILGFLGLSYASPELRNADAS